MLTIRPLVKAGLLLSERPQRRNRDGKKELPSCLSMTERLIGVRISVGRRRRGVRGVMRVRAVRRCRTTLGTERLVGVGSLFSRDTTRGVLLVVVRRATGAAARADDPEQTGGEREGDGQPGGCKHVLPHGALDAVGAELLVEHGSQDGEECRGGGRSGCDEEERHTGDQTGDAATPAAADSEETDDQLDNGGDEGDDIGDKHPLGNTLVGGQGLANAVGKLALNAGALQTPDFEGVEVESGLGLGAGRGVVFVAAGDVSIAVAPETDGVEIGEIQLVGSLVHDGGQVVAGGIDTGIAEKRGHF